jgi:hypothetical protein
VRRNVTEIVTPLSSTAEAMRAWPMAQTHDSPQEDLVAFALDALPAMRMPSGLYSYDRPFGAMGGRGESVRYSLMVLIGLLQARSAGHRVGVDLEGLFDRCLEHRGAFTAGDVGLALWADTRLGGDRIRSLLVDLDRLLRTDALLRRLVGMEVAWLMIGLCLAGHHVSAAAEPFGRVRSELLEARRAPSGMFFHDGDSRLRRHLPNFATEIYTVLALSIAARHLGDGVARRDAITLADHLLRTQLPDGAWPWLFDAGTAKVVERYELYSVHQDAMAPMALLELTEVTGDPRYEAAARRGLAWSRGTNELAVNLLDGAAGFAHRSIRRRAPWNRLALAANATSSLLAGRPLRQGSSSLELQAVSRPYHLGWVLEAWASRTPPAVQG